MQLLPRTRDNSQLMVILEELPKQTSTEDGQRLNNVTTDDVPLPSRKVTLIDDGMAVVHAVTMNKTT